MKNLLKMCRAGRYGSPRVHRPDLNGRCFMRSPEPWTSAGLVDGYTRREISRWPLCAAELRVAGALRVVDYGLGYRVECMARREDLYVNYTGWHWYVGNERIEIKDRTEWGLASWALHYMVHWARPSQEVVELNEPMVYWRFR